jgi:hypothetical protein
MAGSQSKIVNMYLLECEVQFEKLSDTEEEAWEETMSKKYMRQKISLDCPFKWLKNRLGFFLRFVVYCSHQAI